MNGISPASLNAAITSFISIHELHTALRFARITVIILYSCWVDGAVKAKFMNGAQQSKQNEETSGNEAPFVLNLNSIIWIYGYGCI